MRVTKWGEYGILCSLYLAHRYKDGEPCGAAEIAEMQAIPIQYAQQILHRLRKGGIITSIRGPRGGYRLIRPPEEISLRQVFAAAEGETFAVLCEAGPMYGESCDFERHCGLRGVWQELRRLIDEALEQKTLASVLAHHEIINRSEQMLVPGPEGQSSPERG